MFMPRVSGLIENLVRLARGQPLIPQMDRQSGQRTQLVGKGLCLHCLGTHLAGEMPQDCPRQSRPPQSAGRAARVSANPRAGCAFAPASAPAALSAPTRRRPPRQCAGCPRPGRDSGDENRFPASISLLITYISSPLCHELNKPQKNGAPASWPAVAQTSRSTRVFFKGTSEEVDVLKGYGFTGCGTSRK